MLSEVSYQRWNLKPTGATRKPLVGDLYRYLDRDMGRPTERCPFATSEYELRHIGFHRTRKSAAVIAK